MSLVCVLSALMPLPLTAQSDFELHPNPNSVNALFLEGDSILWAGTLGGAVRWDLRDESPTILTSNDGLVSNYVTDIMLARDGTLWCGSFGRGVSSFDGSRWRSYTERDGLVEDRVTDLAEDNEGRVWFGTYNDYAGSLLGGEWNSYGWQQVGKSIHDLLADSRGRVWVAADGVTMHDSLGWHTFGEGEGPPHRFVASIAEDSEGNLWFGSMGNSEGALTVYDGSRWVSYTDELLSGKHQVCLAVDHEGTAWIGTYQGLVRYDGETWEMVGPEEGFTARTAQDIAVDSAGRLYFATPKNGIVVRDGPEWRTLMIPGRRRSLQPMGIATDIDGGILMTGTGYNDKDGFLERYSGGEWQSVALELPAEYDTPSRAMTVDSSGVAWIGTGESGLLAYDGASWAVYDSSDGLPSNRIEAVEAGSGGVLWVATDRGVAARDGSEWTVYDTLDGLADNWVGSLHHDPATGRLYAGTHSGVSVFDNGEWTTLPAATPGRFSRDLVRDVAVAPGGVVWIALDSGDAAWFDGAAWHKYNSGNSALLGSHAYSLAVDRAGNIWCGTDTAVARFDGRLWRSFTAADGLSGLGNFSVFSDREGDIWCLGWPYAVSVLPAESAADTSLPAPDENFRVTAYLPPDGPASVSLNTVEVDRRGNVWFGTTNSGASMFDGSSWAGITSADGLASDFVSVIEAGPDSAVWFVCPTGASRRSGDGQWTTYTAADGMPDNYILDASYDSSGGFWVASYQGVGRFDGEQWTTFTGTDGLLSNDCLAIACDPAGRVVVLHSNGISIHDGGQWSTILSGALLPANFSELAVDRKSHIYAASYNEGLYRYDGSSWSTLAEAEELPGAVVSRILPDPRGVVWVSGGTGGVVRLGRGGTVAYSTAQGLPSRTVTDMTLDPAGNLWLATTGGACRVEVTLEEAGGDGDLDGDGRTGVFDLISLLRVLSGRETDQAVLERADVNGDGVRDIMDLLALLGLL